MPKPEGRGTMIAMGESKESFIIGGTKRGGTPIVAVGESGVCDAVEDGHGGFLTRLDVGQFTETVRSLLLNPEVRREQSCRAREHANRFSLDAMTASLLKVYGTLVEGVRTTWRG